MPSITGSFTAKITKQSGMPLADHPNHELSLAEVTGTQESPDPLWNGSQVTYWAVTDVQDGKARRPVTTITSTETKAATGGRSRAR